MLAEELTLVGSRGRSAELAAKAFDPPSSTSPRHCNLATYIM